MTTRKLKGLLHSSYIDSIIWDQKVYFWNIPSGADIYSCNKINPMLPTALCLLLTLCCSLLFFLQSCVVHCWMSENGAGKLGVNTNVSVISSCFSYVNWCSMCKHVTSWTCHLCHWILLLHNKDQCCISKQFFPFMAMVNKWKSVITPLDCNVRVFWKIKVYLLFTFVSSHLNPLKS